jgi:hypothetical protein
MIKWLLVIVGIPFGIFLIVVGAMSVVSASNLQNQGRLVDATITQSQADTSSNSTGWEIKYEFRVGSSATVYSNGDATGRKNLWVTVPQKPAGTTIPVKFLPSDPWVNDLADPKPSRMESALTGLGAGVVIFLMGGGLLASDIMARRKKKAAAARAVL